MQFTPPMMTRTGRYCLTMAREIYTDLLMSSSVHTPTGKENTETQPVVSDSEEIEFTSTCI